MDTSFYQVILSQHPDHQPDLSVVEQRLPVPEDWPLLLEAIHTHQANNKHFLVTDGQRSVICRSSVPGLYNKVAALEAGNIVHLIGAETVLDRALGQYILDIQQVYTLKEYDNHLKHRQTLEEQRLAKLKAEGFFESFEDVVYISKTPKSQPCRTEAEAVPS